MPLLLSFPTYFVLSSPAAYTTRSSIPRYCFDAGSHLSLIHSAYSSLYKKALNLALNSFLYFPPPSPSFAFTMQQSIPSSMPSALVRGRPKPTYYHNGIGGRGNYHKRAEHADSTIRQQRRPHLPRSIAAIFSSNGNLHNASKTPTLTKEEELSHGKFREIHCPSRWFIGIEGLRNRRARRQDSPSSNMSATTVTSQYSTQALPLGAADVIRRKILGQLSAMKAGND